MKNFRFYKKEYRGKIRWWVDIKPFIFPKRLLIMYPSAEEWLDKIGGGKDEIQIATDTDHFAGAEALYRNKFEGLVRGTLYIAKTYENVETNHQVLLCPVTLYVFGKYPKVIYYRVS
jgi:hypothetical protein